MSFNYEKCKVIHFSKNKRDNVYTVKLGENEVYTFRKSCSRKRPRDLGKLVSKDLNQVNKAVKSANSVIAQIKNSFTYFDKVLIKLLYVSLVRPVSV